MANLLVKHPKHNSRKFFRRVSILCTKDPHNFVGIICCEIISYRAISVRRHAKGRLIA